jgi:hypothetical protein
VETNRWAKIPVSSDGETTPDTIAIIATIETREAAEEAGAGMTDLETVD